MLEDEFTQLGKHIAGATAFIINFIFVNESGYFDNAAETKPMLHLWSLSVEEQFYIVWPLLLWFAWKSKFNFLTIIIIVIATSFSINLFFIESHPIKMFYWPIGRFWEILCGSLVAWFFLYRAESLSHFKRWIDKFFVKIIPFKDKETDGSTIQNLMSFFGLILLAYGIININSDLFFPSKWTLIPVLGTVLVIASGSKAWLNRKLLMNPIAIWFGLISYPLYLWHWPILSFLKILGEEFNTMKTQILTIVLSIFLAWLTFRFVEQPIRLGIKKRWTVFLIILIMIIGGFGILINKQNGFGVIGVDGHKSFFSILILPILNV